MNKVDYVHSLENNEDYFDEKKDNYDLQMPDLSIINIKTGH